MKKDLIEARGLHLIIWRRAFRAEKETCKTCAKVWGWV